MKKLLLTLTLLVAAPAVAQSHLMVEGLLRDNAGKPLDGTFDLTFSLYAAESGGTAVYTEQHVGAVVGAGLFQERIGTKKTLSPTVFQSNGQLWLGVTLAGQPELPRTPLETDPYAFRALTAASAGSLDCTGCIDASHVAFAYAAASAPGGAATSALLAKDLSCTGCIKPEYLQAGLLAAANVSYDDATTSLGATNVQSAIEKLKALIAKGGGGAVEGNGQVASSTTEDWQLQPFGSGKTYVHLFNPTKPKVMMYVYGTSTSSFATGNNLVVAYDFAPNQYSTNVQGKKGESVIQAGNPSAFTPGTHILLYQTLGTGGTGAGAGTWELNAVKSVEGSTVQLVTPLLHDYVDNGPTNGQAQAVTAASYNNLEVVSGGVIHPSAYLDTAADKGGVVFIRAQNVTIHNGGKIHANFYGFQSYKGNAYQQGRSECSASPTQTINNNCSGGGGNPSNTNGYGAGGGGGNKVAGTGASGGSYTAQNGKGGTAKGIDDASILTFGGAGGTGGWGTSGYEGDGGGLVVIGASTLTVEAGGVISANGGDGTIGGSGTYQNGGGAGGSVALFVDTLANAGTIEAKAGKGGPQYNGTYGVAGAGGEGWVHQKTTVPGIVNESFPKGIQIWIDGVNVTGSVGDPNGKGKPHYNAANNTWGADGLTGWESGPLDVTNVANWTLGEHAIELKETGGAGGNLKAYVYVIYPFTASQPPPNDTCATPVFIDPNIDPVVVSGTTEDTMGKTLAKDDSSLAGCGGISGPDVVYKIDLKKRSLINVALVAPFSSKIYLRQGDCAAGTKVACSDKQFTTDPVEPGTYYLFIDSDSANAKGDFKLAVSTTPAPLPNYDTCSSPQDLVLSAQGKATVTGTNLYANDDYKGLCSAALSGGPDVVYHFKAGTGQNLLATLTGGFSSIMYVLTSSCGNNGTPLSCSATGSLNIQGLAGGDYWLVVDGQKEKEWGPFTLSVEVK